MFFKFFNSVPRVFSAHLWRYNFSRNLPKIPKIPYFPDSYSQVIFVSVQMFKKVVQIFMLFVQMFTLFKCLATGKTSYPIYTSRSIRRYANHGKQPTTNQPTPGWTRTAYGYYFSQPACWDFSTYSNLKRKGRDRRSE